MSPVTHLLTGWVIANAAPVGRRGRAIITFGAVIPDIDGLGIIPEFFTRHSRHPLFWFSQYHHCLHTLLFAIIVGIIAFFASGRSRITAAFAFAAFHVHLVEDLIGARGPDGYMWPIPYLFPFSSRWAWVWQGQWALNAWPNMLITMALLVITIMLALKRGCSPVEIFSPKTDDLVVRTLKNRFIIWTSTLL